MADYGAHALNFSVPTSQDDVCDHSPRCMAGACGGLPSSPPRMVKLEPVFRSGHDELGGRGSAAEMMMMVTANSSSRKPRGRPLGSKNRPRPPIVITKECQSGLKSVVIEISAGSDVVESLVQYARSRRVGISVLSGCGSVSNVTLRHPMLQSPHSPAPAMSLHGPFNLLSLSGSFMESLTIPCSFGVCLAGSQGQVFGGIVGGEVIAASLVVVVAATFNKPRFHKLPADPGVATADESDDDTLLGTCNSLQLGGNMVHETTCSGFGSVSSNISAAAMNCPQPISCLEVPQSHHDQLVLPWGGAPSRPPLPPHY